MKPFTWSLIRALNWRAAASTAVALTLRTFYVFAVCGLAVASIVLLDGAGIGIVRDSATYGSLTFSVAMIYVILALMFICWRFRINPVRAFDVLESAKDNPTGLGLFLGLTVFGLCYLAAAVFGTAT